MASNRKEGRPYCPHCGCKETPVPVAPTGAV